MGRSRNIPQTRVLKVTLKCEKPTAPWGSAYTRFCQNLPDHAGRFFITDADSAPGDGQVPEFDVRKSRVCGRNCWIGHPWHWTRRQSPVGVHLTGAINRGSSLALQAAIKCSTGNPDALASRPAQIFPKFPLRNADHRRLPRSAHCW